MGDSRAKHSTQDAGSYCDCCASSMGDAVKVQPTNVDREKFCPRCFCFVRMHSEPERFQASRTAAVLCQFCGWLSVCFNVAFGRATCGHCQRPGAMIVRPRPEDMPELRKAAELLRDAAKKTIELKGGITR